MHPNPMYAIRKKRMFNTFWRFTNIGSIIDFGFKSKEEAEKYLKEELQLFPLFIYEVFPCSRKKIGKRGIVIK